MKKIDIEAILYLHHLKLIQVENKEYSADECDKNMVYLFKNCEELKAYFEENGISDINTYLLDLCILRKTKKEQLFRQK